MIKVLFVCLGNICRSPLAEAIFKDLIKREGLDTFIKCDSAGTSDYHIGSAPDPRTVQNAKKNKIIMDHLARQFSETDFNEYDYIMAMDKNNMKNILSLLESQTDHETKVMLMRKFEPEASEDLEVPDPYYSGEEGFQLVHDILFRTCRNFLNFLKKEHHLQ